MKSIHECYRRTSIFNSIFPSFKETKAHPEAQLKEPTYSRNASLSFFFPFSLLFLGILFINLQSLAQITLRCLHPCRFQVFQLSCRDLAYRHFLILAQKLPGWMNLNVAHEHSISNIKIAHIYLNFGRNLFSWAQIF